LNKVWRINNLYKIRTKNQGVARFKLNDLQIKILHDIAGMKPVRHITLKTRQVGLSTFWEIYWLDDSWFQDGVITGIMAHKRESIEHLTSIVKIAMATFPGRKVEVVEENKTRISFPNNSSILFSLEFRSTPLHNLHISEWCFCDNERVWATVGATNKWTNITGESTGNGIGNDGYLTWMAAKEGNNGFRYRFIPWFAHDEYRMPLNGMQAFVPDAKEKKWGLDQEQIHFRRQMQEKLKSAFIVEYPETEEDAFAQSGIGFFDNRKIVTLVREARDMDSKNEPVRDSLYTIWEPAQPGHLYVLGADTAEGIGADYSTFKILCVTCRAQAMAYRGHVSIDQFYNDINTWGRKYNTAIAGIERNNHGHAVLLGLRQVCKYPKIFIEKDAETRIIVDLSKKRPEPKYGWHTTSITKPLMLDQLKLAVEGDGLEDENNFEPEYRIRDLTFLSECLTFRQDGIKMQAASGYHDDVIMAEAIAFQMYLLAKRGRLNIQKLGRLILGEDRENVVPE
jgi:hypothetical protein